MIWPILCVAVFAHSGDFTPIARECSDAPIAMSDAYLDTECREYESCEVVDVNPEWERMQVCPNVVTSHPIAWVKTLEITLER